jgi:hypothetical protein
MRRRSARAGRAGASHRTALRALGILRLAGAACAVLFLAACDASSHRPFVGQVSRSQYFEYHDRVSEPLCPTLLSLLDRHAQMVGGKLGMPLDPAASPFRYYKFRDASDFATGQSDCSSDLGGVPNSTPACALGDAVYAATYFHAHELAHDYVFRTWGGWSTGLLNEGEAVALSCIPTIAVQVNGRPIDAVGSTDWRSYLDIYGDSDNGYLAAGFFVTYLVEKFGWPALAALHRGVPPGTSAADFEVQFAQVYPMSMDQAWSDALHATNAAPCFKDWDCSASPLSVGETVPVDCDGAYHRSVTVGEAGGVVLSFAGGDGAGLDLVADCTAAAPPTYFYAGQGASPVTHWAMLPPGTYTILPVEPYAPSSVTLQGDLPSPLVGAACDSAATVQLDPQGVTFVDFAPGTYTGYLRIAGNQVPSYDVDSYALSALPGPASILSLCDGCGADASCVPVEDGPNTVAIPAGAVLRFQDVLAGVGLIGGAGAQLSFVAPTDAAAP